MAIDCDNCGKTINVYKIIDGKRLCVICTATAYMIHEDYMSLYRCTRCEKKTSEHNYYGGKLVCNSCLYVLCH